MTLHNQKQPRKSKPARREPRPLTLGDILGDAVRADRAAKARAAELAAMGFKPIGER